MNVHSLSSSGPQISDHWQSVADLKVAKVHTALLKIYSGIIPYIVWGQICTCVLHLHIKQTKFQLWDDRRQLLKKPKSSSCLTQRPYSVTHWKEASGEKLQSRVTQNSLSGLFWFVCLFVFLHQVRKGCVQFSVVSKGWSGMTSQIWHLFPTAAELAHTARTALCIAHWKQTVD